MFRRKPLAIVSVLTAISMPVLAILFFHLIQRHHRREMWEHMEEKAAVTVRIQAHELEWVKPGKEIKLKGHLFDILSITELANGYVEIKGLFDTQEQQLVKLMKQQAGAPDQKNTAHLIQLFKISCSNQLFDENNFDQVSLTKPSWWIPLAESLAFFTGEVLAPPPQVA